MCRCVPAENAAGEVYSRWVADFFGDCVYSDRELLSVYVALLSIVCWSCAQLPQIITIARTGVCEGLNLTFMLNWLQGDAASLLGAILTKQLPTQILTALYFVVMDVVIILQFMYYPSIEDLNAAPDEKLPKPPDLTVDDYDATMELSKSQRGRLDEQEDTTYVAAEDATAGTAVNNNNNTRAAGLTLPALFIGMVLLSSHLPCLSAFQFDGVVVFSGNTKALPPNTEEPICGAYEDVADWQLKCGVGLGWYSMLVYLVSRIPQIIQNYRSKSVKGLAAAMFIFAVLGNVLYSLAIVLRADSWEMFDPKIPWLIGSLGTSMFDITVLVQFGLYHDTTASPYETAPLVKRK
eukprot:gnl/Spiro4/25738_TR12797_c0_g1_i1.p1 gnl/Spiro4/25738_TR12797_c0_g1~~gnl/Spiro4/25738_TR12797_c0_g1_i1.p1  ORF type:complete len:350 (+),score=50.24 gnl/Spiro4/25738_TR12797_c0_g1_i1:101-1150(+)